MQKEAKNLEESGRLQAFFKLLRGHQTPLASSALVLLRLSIGWLFLYSGIDKLLTELNSGGTFD